MTYELVDPNKQTRRPGWLRALLIIGFVLSLLVGLGAFAAFYWLGQQEETPVETTSPAVDIPIGAQGIPPNLALLELGGADPAALARQATNARERYLAHAILRTDPSLPPTLQASNMARTAALFIEAGESALAMDALRTTRIIALTAPEITPLDKGTLLAQVAQGLIRLDQNQEALETALQAQHVAVQAPDLLPAQRIQTLESVASLIRNNGTEQQAQRIQELQRNPSLALNRAAIPSQWATLRQVVPLSPELAEAVRVRQQAVEQLQARLAVAATADIEPERQALRAALIAEDQLRAQRYAQINDPTFSLAQQHELIQSQREWILLKLRIGQGGFGLVLMPEWSSQADALRLSLSQVTNNLIPVLESQIAARADPAQAVALRAESLRWLAQQSELGFYPDVPLGDLATRLGEAEALLVQNGLPPALPLFYDTSATPPGFRIQQLY